jgi:peptidoglycan/LPS O-acetylase OafA/YrhL
MHPPNHTPTERNLGTSDEHRGPLPQVARNRRLARLGRVGIATLAAVVLVLVLAAVVVGPGKAIDWLGNYLIPVLVVLGVIVGVCGLAAWEIAKLQDRHKQPW